MTEVVIGETEMEVVQSLSEQAKSKEISHLKKDKNVNLRLL